MKKTGSVNVGRDAVGNVITTGVRNRIDSKIAVQLVKTSLPSAGSVDLPKELADIRAILERIGGEHTGKVGRALDDAAEEAHKPQPNKDEIGTALSRALDYAKKSNGFAEEMKKLAPHVVNAAAWLGSNWHHLLGLVGLVS
jgi:hypothetical protein